MSTVLMDPPAAGQEEAAQVSETPIMRIMRTATELYARKEHWSIFHQQVFGPTGSIKSTLTRDEYAQFKTTENWTHLWRMMSDLRKRDCRASDRESERVITVRLPRSLHARLKQEAHEHETSLNQLCIDRLLVS
jgi:predicted HicB family RNase H-like nuclease